MNCEDFKLCIGCIQMKEFEAKWKGRKSFYKYLLVNRNPCSRRGWSNLRNNCCLCRNGFGEAAFDETDDCDDDDVPQEGCTEGL